MCAQDSVGPKVHPVYQARQGCYRSNTPSVWSGRKMKTILKIAIFPALLCALAPASFADTIIYNNIPGTLPPNLVSEPYEAVQSDDFGGLIQFAGSSPSYALTSATVEMS